MLNFVTDVPGEILDKLPPYGCKPMGIWHLGANEMDPGSDLAKQGLSSLKS